MSEFNSVGEPPPLGVRKLENLTQEIMQLRSAWIN